MGWDRVTAGVHYSFTVRVARPVTDLVILQSSISHLTPTNLIISPPALLLVLYGVHVVQQHGAVLVGPDEDNVKVDMLLVASKGNYDSNCCETNGRQSTKLARLESSQTGNWAW